MESRYAQLNFDGKNINNSSNSVQTTEKDAWVILREDAYLYRTHWTKLNSKTQLSFVYSSAARVSFLTLDVVLVDGVSKSRCCWMKWRKEQCEQRSLWFDTFFSFRFGMLFSLISNAICSEIMMTMFDATMRLTRDPFWGWI